MYVGGGGGFFNTQDRQLAQHHRVLIDTVFQNTILFPLVLCVLFLKPITITVQFPSPHQHKNVRKRSDQQNASGTCTYPLDILTVLCMSSG